MGAQSHFAQIAIAADAAEYDILVLGGLRRSRGGVAAILALPLLGLFRVAVLDRHVMATLFQVTRHRIAHHAQADECHFHLVHRFHLRGCARRE
jgi:hypothetical protein